MGQFHFEKIATELRLTLKQVQATATLLDEGATVPFIARYRKEATASLDEVELTTIRDRLAQLRELSQRQNAILNSLEQRGPLTEDLRQSILAAESVTALEDIYLPYRPKRRTRATIAREKGLEPLARLLWDQGDIDPVREAAAYVDPKGAIETPEEAPAGARDIIAEWVSEDATARAQLRELFLSQGILISCVAKGKEA
ncbi:MAG TPA: Tex-like N-terminal domain-containing protein, partial [Dehalococcoidia bacterium]|nr:Tex-like N-terminal domain-containing protein [Dehalococcoidia bacterium]